MTTNPAATERLTLREVYEAERHYVWKSLRRLGIPERHIEDVAHDVFVVAHRQLEHYDPSRPLKPWLFGIAFRVSSDFRRKASNVRELPGADEVEVADANPSAEDQLEAHRARQLVHAALRQLEPERRAVMILHDIDGQPVPEIARSLEIPLNTAYSRLRLARGEFAKEIRQIQQRGAR